MAKPAKQRGSIRQANRGRRINNRRAASGTSGYIQLPRGGSIPFSTGLSLHTGEQVEFSIVNGEAVGIRPLRRYSK